MGNFVTLQEKTKVFTAAKMVLFFFNNPPQMLQLAAQNWVNKEDLSHAIPTIKKIFSNFQISAAPCRKSKIFSGNLGNFDKRQFLLRNSLRTIILNKEETNLVTMEMKEMFKKVLFRKSGLQKVSF